MIYSFDIFDTCITRRYCRPSDLFYDLAKNITSRQQEKLSERAIQRIAKSRVQAEKRARVTARKREEITLKEIYGNFYELSQWNIDPEQMMREEMELERESLVPILSTRLKIDALRKQGNRIIFISDMYLPGEFIRNLLLENRFAFENEPVYVSSDVGLTKRTGGLFKHVLSRERLLPTQLHHYGDNSKADFVVPSKLGIKATVFKDIELSRQEKHLLRKFKSTPSVISKITGLNRVARLSANHESRQTAKLANIAANVIAPLLVSYVHWVVTDAKEKGIKRLYFVSRDGQIFLEIARSLSKAQSPPEFRYLYGSRQALYLPSIIDLNTEDVDWLIHTHNSRSILDILKRLDISIANVKKELVKFGLSPDSTSAQLSNEELKVFWQFLLSPSMSQYITKRASKARALVSEYFRQEGLFDDDSWALVDTGWRLTCQRSIKRILTGTAGNVNVHGYYLGVKKDHMRLTETGTFSAFIYQRDGHCLTGKKHPWLFDQGTASVIENLFTISDHPSVEKYIESSGRILPVFRAKDDQVQLFESFETVRKTVLNYVNELTNTDILETYPEFFMEAALTTSSNFFTRPVKEDIEIISALPVDIEQSHHPEHARTLASPLSFGDIARMVFYFFRPSETRFVDSSHAWYHGSAALSNPIEKSLFYMLMHTKSAAEKFYFAISQLRWFPRSKSSL